MFQKKNNIFITSFFFAAFVGLIHFLIVFIFFPFITKLVAVIYLFLLIWMVLYMLILKKIHNHNNQYVISGFMILTFKKMILSVILLLILKYYTLYSPLIIITNFFIGFFTHLLLQVNYSIKLLR
jgi:hypothetical protein